MLVGYGRFAGGMSLGLICLTGWMGGLLRLIDRRNVSMTQLIYWMDGSRSGLVCRMDIARFYMFNRMNKKSAAVD